MLPLKKEIINISQKYHCFPKKYLGQNFLIDNDTIKEIIKTANLSLKDIVLEIGPGSGILTRELAKKSKQVIAIEKDRRMIKILKEELKNYKNIKIIESDILKIDFRFLPQGSYKIVSNPPYYLVLHLIRKFLESKFPPSLMVLLVQKEVGERICALPPKMNLAAVAVQLYSKPEIIKIIKKDNSWPQPKVDSALIKISQIKKTSFLDLDLFFRIVKAGFSHPRKQLKNNLKKIFKEKTEEILKAHGINSSQRAETIPLKKWLELTAFVKSSKNNP